MIRSLHNKRASCSFDVPGMLPLYELPCWCSQRCVTCADTDQLPACLGHSQQRPGAGALAQVSQLTLQRSPLSSALAGGAELGGDLAGGCWCAALANPASLIVLQSFQGCLHLHDTARARAACSEQPLDYYNAI